MIADTSVWIDWLRGDEGPPANLLQAELDAGHPVCALPWAAFTPRHTAATPV